MDSEGETFANRASCWSVSRVYGDHPSPVPKEKPMPQRPLSSENKIPHLSHRSINSAPRGVRN